MIKLLQHRIFGKPSRMMTKKMPQSQVWCGVCASSGFLFIFRSLSFMFSSCTEGCLLTKVVFHGWSSSTRGGLPPKVVFHWRLSSTKGRLVLKVVFHRRLSSTDGRLPPKVGFHRTSSFTYHNTLVEPIFLRTVNIPNLSPLPCLEVF